MLLPLQFHLPALKDLPEGVKVGSRVGAGRWGDDHAHPDCWQKPWAGTVLALDDPAAWAGTIAFPEGSPQQMHVSEHVRKILERGLLQDKVPVRWDFGRVLWEKCSIIRTVEEDIADFEAARELARRNRK